MLMTDFRNQLANLGERRAYQYLIKVDGDNKENISAIVSVLNKANKSRRLLLLLVLLLLALLLLLLSFLLLSTFEFEPSFVFLLFLFCFFASLTIPLFVCLHRCAPSKKGSLQCVV